MSLRHELQVLRAMLVSPIKGGTHAERLNRFYAGQAEAYDGFRRRLLHGRRELWTTLALPAGGVWVDMGGGTAANFDYIDKALDQLARVYVVDLCPSLLQVAKHRIDARGWTNVTLVEGDVTTFRPPEAPVDVVTFSYSLTMIPDWFAALEHAWQLLRPGGIIGVVDFYISRKYPPRGCVRHGWLTRTLWPIWFGFNNVFPSADHIPYLQRCFASLHFSEYGAPMPYVVGVRVPYYLFIGRKIPRQ